MSVRNSKTVIIMLGSTFLVLLTVSLTKPSAYNDVGMRRIGRAFNLDHIMGGQVQYRPPPIVEETFDAWHVCLSEALAPAMNDSNELWSKFRDSVNGCASSTLMKHIALSGASNKDKYKFHIFNKTDKTPSIVITLGVGWDVLAEKRLKEMLPNGSQFYGADPIYEKNAELYSEVGQFFPLAVGNETKVSKAYVMPKELGGYAYKLLIVSFAN
ncbi:hypothetical protein COOONC_21518 [Cooperia oncophora]